MREGRAVTLLVDPVISRGPDCEMWTSCLLVGLMRRSPREESMSGNVIDM